ncbi:MAG: rod shape-determining protein RodA, partial [Prolixibacteraceae bacterium]|nr:rod shape-determining protein RodA [Prolixibacteraceae bacterium]
MPRRNNVWVNIDWLTVSLYLMLVFLGWINIYASVYSEEHQSIFDLSQRYGKQIIWISAALIIGFVILLIETNFYVFFSYIIFGILVFLLILVLFVGTEINGAKSWFILGDFGIQPSEFAKFATGLALARYMSSFGFKIQRFKSLITIVVIVFLPTILILLQNDTGSALVYFSFILVLYREGLSGVVLFFALLVTLLFVFALLFSNFIMMVVLLLAAIFAFLILNPRIKQFVIILSIFIVSIALFYVLNLILKTNYKIAEVLVVSSIIGGAVVLGYSIRKKFKNYIIVALVFLGSVLFSISVDYAFNNMLAPHHQARINELLGIQSDLLGAGYNVNQSKIAIGSGGLWGKGYLQGTQTKFNFVPEQSTDFIFCTVGEEWGFAGTFTVVVLFLFLLIRLVFLSERQRSGFSRIYGYTVAVILFFHFMVNIGMT